jgi:YgiT-type zinc finger domain-containing protein
MNDPALMHALYRLADYPVLAELARSSGTEAIKLDGRACLYLYQDGLGDIDWLTVSVAEKDFMRALGLFSICPCCGVRGLVRDTRDHVLNRSDGSAATIKALTGDYCNACGEVILDAAEGQRLMDATRGGAPHDGC